MQNDSMLDKFIKELKTLDGDLKVLFYFTKKVGSDSLEFGSFIVEANIIYDVDYVLEGLKQGILFFEDRYGFHKVKTISWKQIADVLHVNLI